MPFYKLPLVTRIEPLTLDLMTENDMPLSGGFVIDPKKKIFIYKPASKGNVDRKVVWYKGKIHTIRVFTEYPLLIPIQFNKVHAITKGIKAINYISTVNTKDIQAFDIKVKPLEVGLLTICGVCIGFASVYSDHYVKINGVGVYEEKYERKYNDRVCEINVIDEVPQISIRIESIQLLNGILVGIKEEQCMLSIYIKNTSILSVEIKKLFLVVHSKRLNKTKQLKKIDVISLIGCNPLHGEWYKIKYSALITDKYDSYVFEFLFGSEADVIIAEKREVPIIIETSNERRREEVPGVKCINWNWYAKTEWPEVLQLAKKALKNKKRVFCCSEFVNIVVELQNQSSYNFSHSLYYEDKILTGLELESWNNKSLAAEVPYDIMLRDKIMLEWEILGSLRKGKNLLSNFVNMKDKIPMVTFLPIRINLETESVSRKLKVGDMVTITMITTNISQTNIKNLYPTIMVVRCTARVQEMINRDPFSLNVSGQLTHYIEELNINEEYRQSVTILFTDRNIYRIGGMCDFEEKDLAYVAGQKLIFEVE